MKAKPAEIWPADLGLAAKARPVVILSRDDPQAPRALVIYVPLTTQNRGSRYEVDLGKLSFLKESSVANVQGIGSLPDVRLEKKIGVLPPTLFAQIKDALAFAVEL
jgi:mRNA interferase MazF